METNYKNQTKFITKTEFAKKVNVSEDKVIDLDEFDKSFDNLYGKLLKSMELLCVDTYCMKNLSYGKFTNHNITSLEFSKHVFPKDRETEDFGYKIFGDIVVTLSASTLYNYLHTNSEQCGYQLFIEKCLNTIVNDGDNFDSELFSYLLHCVDMFSFINGCPIMDNLSDLGLSNKFYEFITTNYSSQLSTMYELSQSIKKFQNILDENNVMSFGKPIHLI